MNPDGTTAWTWENGNPATEFDALPPLKFSTDGTFLGSVADPAAIVLDCEKEFAPGDLAELMKDLASARIRQDPVTKVWHFKKRILIGGQEVEIDHPVELIRAARARLKGNP